MGNNASKATKLASASSQTVIRRYPNANIGPVTPGGGSNVSSDEILDRKQEFTQDGPGASTMHERDLTMEQLLERGAQRKYFWDIC
jgi:hypothetical protein